MLGRFAGKVTGIRDTTQRLFRGRGPCAEPFCPVSARPTARNIHRPTLPGMQPETRHAPLG